MGVKVLQMSILTYQGQDGVQGSVTLHSRDQVGKVGMKGPWGILWLRCGDDTME